MRRTYAILILSVLLVLGLVGGGVAFADHSPPNNYTDINNDCETGTHPCRFHDAIEWGAEEGVFDSAGGEFRPNVEIKRNAMALQLYGFWHNLVEPAIDEAAGGGTFEGHKPTAQIITVAAGETKSTKATCPDGQTAVSGGYELEGVSQAEAAGASVLRDQPVDGYTEDDPTFDAWQVEVANTNADGDFTVQVAVVCQ